eukprot:scaffold23496_cov188-Cylindrotheca_fusiformis.AAC.4
MLQLSQSPIVSREQSQEALTSEEWYINSSVETSKWAGKPGSYNSRLRMTSGSTKSKLATAVGEILE